MSGSHAPQMKNSNTIMRKRRKRIALFIIDGPKGRETPFTWQAPNTLPMLCDAYRRMESGRDSLETTDVSVHVALEFADLIEWSFSEDSEVTAVFRQHVGAQSIEPLIKQPDLFNRLLKLRVVLNHVLSRKRRSLAASMLPDNLFVAA